jgi:hypothetical protein
VAILAMHPARQCAACVPLTMMPLPSLGSTLGSRTGAAIGDLLEAYEAKRWPDGKEPGGKG